MDNYQKIEKIGEGMDFRRDCYHLQLDSRVDILQALTVWSTRPVNLTTPTVSLP